jgi:hypothetical protein
MQLVLILKPGKSVTHIEIILLIFEMGEFKADALKHWEWTRIRHCRWQSDKARHWKNAKFCKRLTELEPGAVPKMRYQSLMKVLMKVLMGLSEA